MSNASSNPETPQTMPHEPVSSRLPHPLTGFLVTIAVFLGGSIGASFLVSFIMSVTGGSDTGLLSSDITLQSVYMAIAYGLMFTGVYTYARRGKFGLRVFGVRRVRLVDVGLAILAFMAYIGIYLAAVTALQSFIPALNVEQKQDIGFDNAHGLSLLPIFILLVFLVPFVEELIMRGVLYSSLRSKLRFSISAVLTSAIFAALHLNGGEAGAGPLWIAAIDTFVLSLVLCYLRERTGRIWAGVGLHAIKNSVAFAALFIFVSNT